MSVTAHAVDWTEHDREAHDCRGCDTGYPRVCACGGAIHGELMPLEDGAFVLVTECGSCEQPQVD